MAKLKSTDYRRLVELCKHGRRGTVTVGACTIGNNTTAELDDDATVTIRLHGHPIVRLYESGDTAWTLAGWPTVTTRERVNQFLPIGQRVYQHRGEQRQSWPAFRFDRAGWRPVESDRWYRVSELVYRDEVAS